MKTLLPVIFLLYSFFLTAQTQWINGFAGRIAGENLEYHSCHPEANLALLIRCFNDSNYIEWQTDTVLPEKSKFITFAWIAGYSVGTSTASHKFYLYVNDRLLFDFNTSPDQPERDWQINSQDGSGLYFKFIRLDPVDDFFGYMLLTIPAELLGTKNFAKIKIKGDATNSKDWYMTMQYPLIPKIRISPEKVVSKDSLGNLLQRVKVSVDHFDAQKPVKIESEAGNISSVLKLGMNDFYLNFTAPRKPMHADIKITIDNMTRSHPARIDPAREITFYLIPHAHVDIGYTGLQTEVEKKHWDNFDKAIEYSLQSAQLGSDALFKWNVETLWAVKSYLENFPEKKVEFFKAVKNGWIGLDATYVNVMTALCRPEELYRLVDYSNELEKENGIKIETAMISDIPGYTWGIVGAFADNGVKYFSVGTNEFDRIGNTLKTWGDKPFYWLSPCGKKKILIWLAGKGYSWFHKWRLTRDDFSPIAKYLDELDQQNYPYDMVHLRYNIGGDNGFPDSALSSFVKQWNDTHLTPKFKIATNAQMFKDLEARYSDKIPVLSGDLTPYWEDGAGSTANETALNRNTAELLNQLEILYTLYNRNNFPKKDLDEAWRNVLLYSEHTWGAWNSISDPEIDFVKDQWEIKKSYAVKADSIAQRLLKDLRNIAGVNNEIKQFYVCNSSSWERSDVVGIPGAAVKSIISIKDEKGIKIPVQKLTNGDFVFTAGNIPPLGFKRYTLEKEQTETARDSSLFNGTLSNNYYSLFYNEKLTGISFINRTGINFNYVDTLQSFVFNEFIHTGKNAENPVSAGNPELLHSENGSVLKSVTLKSEGKGCNSLLQQVTLYNDLDKIEIINRIDKGKIYDKENIRFAFPLNIEDPVSRIDLAWAVIRPEKDQLAGSNKNYFTVQRWIDISNSQNGVTIAATDAPFIELGGMTAEAWMSSPDKEWSSKTSSSPLLYSWAMNNSWHTNFKASQEGPAAFKYVLRFHNQFDYLSAYKFGIECSQPLQIIFDDTKIKKYCPVIELDSASSIVLTTLKPGREGSTIIARIFNPSDKSSSSQIKFNGFREPSVFLSNGDEDEIKQVDNILTLDPFEVVTLKIKENKPKEQ